MKRTIFGFLFALLWMLPFITLAQTSGSKNVSITLPTVALLDIELAANKNIAMNFTAPTEAGRPLTNPANNTSLWVNYTSAVATGSSRSVSAKVSAIIPGIDIKLTAAAASGTGGGTRGITAGQKILTTSDQSIITGIGGAFTGNGVSNGHQLTFALSPNTYANIVKTNTTITVIYTLSN